MAQKDDTTTGGAPKAQNAYAARYTSMTNAYKKGKAVGAVGATPVVTAPPYKPTNKYDVPKAPEYTGPRFVRSKGTIGGVSVHLSSRLLGNTDNTNNGGGGGYGGGYGYGGGGYEEPPPPPEITWSTYDSKTQGPSWWKAMKPSEMNADTEFLATMNALIPFLSEEDQKAVASTLYQLDAKNFGHLNPEEIQVNPVTELTTGVTDMFRSSERAQKALDSLTELSNAVGKSDKDLGPGYRYLRSLLNISKQFGGQGADRQTRRQYTQMMGALDPLLSSSKSGDLAPYGSLARMLTTPFFSAGQLVPVTRAEDGRYIFGNPNKSLM